MRQSLARRRGKTDGYMEFTLAAPWETWSSAKDPYQALGISGQWATLLGDTNHAPAHSAHAARLRGRAEAVKTESTAPVFRRVGPLASDRDASESLLVRQLGALHTLSAFDPPPPPPPPPPSVVAAAAAACLCGHRQAQSNNQLMPPA